MYERDDFAKTAQGHLPAWILPFHDQQIYGWQPLRKNLKHLTSLSSISTTWSLPCPLNMVTIMVECPASFLTDEAPRRSRCDESRLALRCSWSAFDGWRSCMGWPQHHHHHQQQQQQQLAGGLEHFLFFHILGIIILTDFHIFRRGWNHQPDDHHQHQHHFQRHQPIHIIRYTLLTRHSGHQLPRHRANPGAEQGQAPQQGLGLLRRTLERGRWKNLKDRYQLDSVNFS